MPPKAAQITVAIPTCNGATTLAATLRSILAQDGPAFDLILCDDRSTDDTSGIVREVAGDRARVLVNAERLGLAGNWNRCVEVARTPFVAVFHQDDLMRPGHLGAHCRQFAQDPDLGWVASASGVIDKGGEPVPETVVGRGGLGASDRTFEAGEALPLMAIENPLRCSAVTVSSRAHEEAGGFSPDYRYVVDWDFWIRVARRRKVAWLATPSVDVRWHLASETHRFATSTDDLEETSRLLDALDEGRSVRHLADRRLSRAYLNRAYVAMKAEDPKLARVALRNSVRLWPGILGRIATDPRLAIRLAGLAFRPRGAADPDSPRPSRSP